MWRSCAVTIRYQKFFRTIATEPGPRTPGSIPFLFQLDKLVRTELVRPGRMSNLNRPGGAAADQTGLLAPDRRLTVAALVQLAKKIANLACSVAQLSQAPRAGALYPNVAESEACPERPRR